MSIFSPADLECARQRIQRHAWAADILAAVRERAERWSASPAKVPALAGGWVHDYVCPEHWTTLTFDATSPQVHRCPFGESHRGEKLDAAWRVLEHRRIANAARDLGLVYALARARAHADDATDLLLQYSERYARFAGSEGAPDWMLKGRVFNQALTEAIWTVPIAHAYDLIHDTLTPAQNAQVVDGLLRPLVGTLMQAQDELVHHRQQLKSNYNAWLIAALGLLGYALNDPALVERAIDGEAGFRAHLAAAVLPDGFEYEGTPYYHNFVALAYSTLAEAARANGRDLYAERAPGGQSIQSMWQALAALAHADGSIPQVNDGAGYRGGPFDLELGEGFEIALARTHHTLYAWLLQASYRRRGPDARRDTWTALLYAEQDIAHAAEPPRTSALLPSVGLAVLRQTENPLEVCVPFGEFAGSHSHFDRLGIHVYPFATDPGTPLYGVPARVEWFQQTAAHNAIVVDAQSQGKCGGRLVEWSESANAATIELTTETAHPGVKLSRRLTLSADKLVDVVTLESEGEHTYDWILHVDGECQLAKMALTPAGGKLADEGAYRFATILARSEREREMVVGITLDHHTYRLALSCSVPHETIVAQSPAGAGTPQRPRQMLIARAHGMSVTFSARYEAVQ